MTIRLRNVRKEKIARIQKQQDEFHKEAVNLLLEEAESFFEENPFQDIYVVWGTKKKYSKVFCEVLSRFAKMPDWKFEARTQKILWWRKIEIDICDNEKE